MINVTGNIRMLVVCALMAILTAVSGNTAAEARDIDNETVVAEFIAAWSRLDAAELIAYFAPDGVYHNMMLEPVSGHEKLKEFIQRFIDDWSETRWEVINLMSRGDVVIAERVDHTRIADKRVALPCVGVFEMRGGKIEVWRDYFDLATYQKAFIEN